VSSGALSQLAVNKNTALRECILTKQHARLARRVARRRIIRLRLLNTPESSNIGVNRAEQSSFSSCHVQTPRVRSDGGDEKERPPQQQQEQTGVKNNVFSQQFVMRDATR
jgi:hypothetical protein